MGGSKYRGLIIYFFCTSSDEVYKLSGRGALNMDHKLDQVRHDLNEDIQMLNSQLQNLRTTGNNRVSDNQFYSLSKDVQDV